MLPLLGAFIVAVGLIVWAGSYLAWVTDKIADHTGMGEAVAGAMLMGAVTSLPGFMASVTAAWEGYAQMAVGNCIGSIAVQTLFLAFADIACRRGNLEHISASLPNLFQCGLLILLLAIALLGHAMPGAEFWSISPFTLILVAVYIYGMRLAGEIRDNPMWKPKETSITQTDADDGLADPDGPSLSTLWLRFAFYGFFVGLGGWLVARSGIGLIQTAGLSEGVVGSLITAIASSLPELITSIAAVRQGSYALAVGGIIGGNALDTLFLAASDVAYRDGSLFAAIDQTQSTWILITIMMTAVLFMGLVRRERTGPANIGLESISLIALYALGVVILFV